MGAPHFAILPYLPIYHLPPASPPYLPVRRLPYPILTHLLGPPFCFSVSAGLPFYHCGAPSGLPFIILPFSVPVGFPSSIFQFGALPVLKVYHFTTPGECAGSPFCHIRLFSAPFGLPVYHIFQFSAPIRLPSLPFTDAPPCRFGCLSFYHFRTPAGPAPAYIFPYFPI